jgi:hypothetical protein
MHPDSGIGGSNQQPPASALSLLLRYQCLVYTLTIFLVRYNELVSMSHT